MNWKFWQRGPVNHRAKARSYYNGKNYKMAEKHLLSLLDKHPTDTWALDVLGRLLMNTSRHLDAVQVWNDYILAGGDLGRGLSHLSKCQRVNGDIDNAFETLKQVLLESSDDGVWEEIHKTIDSAENINQIIKFRDSLETEEIPQVALGSVQLRLDILTNNPSAAADTFSTLLTMNETNSQEHIIMTPKWRVLVAEILLNADLHKEAINLVSTLEENEPRRNRIEITAQRLRGEHNEASKIIDKASVSDDHGILLASIRLAWDIGDMDGVIELSEKLLKDKNQEPIATRFRIQALVKKGDMPNLRVAVKKTLHLNPNNLDALRTATDLAFSEDCDWQLTIELSDTILTVNPADRRALCHKAIALARLGFFDKSAIILEEAKRIHPENNEVDLAFAEVARQQGDGFGQICSVNRIFERNGYSSINSRDNEHRLNIQYLSSETPNAVESGQPLVSIIMTAYQRDDLLDVAIDSILNQTHSNLELIIIDDFSPDDTFEYIQSRAEKEPRIRAFQTTVNGGTYLAKNLGLIKSKGKFIGFMDSDDWTHPQRIERQLSSFENKKIMGICDAYFRIDDESHIPYRGKGASRMACISLLMRREVLERNGFFDALRVGADTEYIERISASFGEDAFHFTNIPTMLMTQHGTSLTGGGRFHISWRSITGHRLGHHSVFRAWHKKIIHGEALPYLPHPLRVRPFEAPKEMLSGPYQWDSEKPLFSELIAQRNHRWWVEKKAPWQSYFSQKMRGRRFAETAEVAVPEMYWKGLEMSEIPQLEDLPSRVVIKPSVGWSANNVFCLIDGVNVLDNESYNLEKILKILEGDAFLSGQSATYMCEEFLIPESGRESDVIPRDYKFYCFGEEIALVHVVLRRSVKDKYANVHHYLDSDFREISRKMITTREVPEDAFPMPDCWAAMVKDVRTLGKEMGCFMRIDMFATDKGPVFGEFTPTPEGGKGYTEWADKYLATFWKGLEGDDEGSITEPPEWVVEGGLM